MIVKKIIFQFVLHETPLARYGKYHLMNQLPAIFSFICYCGKPLTKFYFCTLIEYLTFNSNLDTIEEIDKRNIKAVENLLNQTQFFLAPLWIDVMKLGNNNVFVALILPQLSNLQTIYLNKDFFANNQFFSLVFQFALSPNRSSIWPVSNFSYLHNVSFFIPKAVAGMNRSLTFASVDTDQIMSLLYLSTI